MEITPQRYLDLRERLFALGWYGDWQWAETVSMPTTPHAFACEYTWVVLNSGMKNTVARGIMDRVWPAVTTGHSAASVFGHEAKAAAIDDVWARREALYIEARAAEDLVEWCRGLSWIGPITCWHLAKNLGADVCKPDRWLKRLAEAEGTTPCELCERLSGATGDRVATVDLMLWRACAIGLLVPGELFDLDEPV